MPQFQFYTLPHINFDGNKTSIKSQRKLLCSLKTACREGPRSKLGPQHRKRTKASYIQPWFRFNKHPSCIPFTKKTRMLTYELSVMSTLTHSVQRLAEMFFLSLGIYSYFYILHHFPSIAIRTADLCIIFVLVCATAGIPPLKYHRHTDWRTHCFADV